jgi:hypothetical protein
MFLSGIQEDLVVFVTGEHATPNYQYQEYGGYDSPDDQKIKERPFEQKFYRFHTVLPLETLGGVRLPKADKAYLRAV